MYKIIVDYTPSDADNAIVKKASLHSIGKEFSIFLKDDLGKFFRGIQAFLVSIYIEILWIEKTFENKDMKNRC